MTFTEKSTLSRYILLVLLALLILYYLSFHIIFGKDILFRVSVSVIPLLIFVPGLVLRKYRSASLLCFVLLLYFIDGVQVLFSPGKTALESIAMTLICSLFTVAMLYSRWQQRADVLESN